MVVNVHHLIFTWVAYAILHNAIFRTDIMGYGQLGYARLKFS